MSGKGRVPATLARGRTPPVQFLRCPSTSKFVVFQNTPGTFRGGINKPSVQLRSASKHTGHTRDARGEAGLINPSFRPRDGPVLASLPLNLILQSSPPLLYLLFDLSLLSPLSLYITYFSTSLFINLTSVDFKTPRSNYRDPTRLMFDVS